VVEKKIVKSSDLSSLKDLKGKTIKDKSVKNNIVLEELVARQRAIVLSDLLPVHTLMSMLQSLPEDSKIVRVVEDVSRNKKMLFVLSREFSKIEPGETIPEIKFVFDNMGKIDTSLKESKGFLDALEDL
jgi:hypothetical protein